MSDRILTRVQTHVQRRACQHMAHGLRGFLPSMNARLDACTRTPMNSSQSMLLTMVRQFQVRFAVCFAGQVNACCVPGTPMSILLGACLRVLTLIHRYTHFKLAGAQTSLPRHSYNIFCQWEEAHRRTHDPNALDTSCIGPAANEQPVSCYKIWL